MRVEAALTKVAHLARRFFASLRAREPRPEDLEWVRASLEPAEWEQWCRLGRADRAESIATARRLRAPLAADPRWRAAALLHDVGKAEADLGTVARVVATGAGVVFGKERVAGRLGAYLRHAHIGAARLAAAGARPEAVAWAGAHHDPDRWRTLRIPLEVCEALARADGEAVGS